MRRSNHQGRPKNGRRSRRGGGNSTGRIPRPIAQQGGRGDGNGLIGGIPLSKRVKLKYVDFIQLTAGIGGCATLPYGLNCLYDPYLGSGGHQPANFDFWMQQYSKYTVTHVKAVMNYFSSSSSSGTTQCFGMLGAKVSGQVVAGTDPLDLMEQPQGCYSQFVSGITNGPAALSPLSMSFDIASWFGTKRNGIVGQDAFSGSSGANPANILYLDTWAGAVMGNTPSSNSSQYKLELIYDVEFWGPVISVPSMGRGWRHNLPEEEEKLQAAALNLESSNEGPKAAQSPGNPTGAPPESAGCGPPKGAKGWLF